MKKHLALLLIGTVCLSLTACGNSSAASSESTAETSAADTAMFADSAESNSAAEDTAAAPADEEANTDMSEPETEEQPAASLTYETEAVPMQYTDENGTELLDYSYETIKVTSDGYDALNEALGSMTDSVASELQEQYDADLYTLTNTGDFNPDTVPWYNHYTIEVVNASPEFMSLWVCNDSFLGGAHPNAYRTGHTFSSVTGDEIELRYALANYDELYEEVLDKLSQNEYANDFFEDYKDTVYNEFYGEEASLCWTEDSDTLHIYFNDYDVAPHAIGPVEIDLDAAKYPITVSVDYSEGIANDFLEVRTGKDIFSSYDEIIQNLASGEAYAYLTLDGYDGELLAISSSAYDNLDGNMASIEAYVYGNVDGNVVSIGNAFSNGTAYPIRCDGKLLYTAGNHDYTEMCVCPDTNGLMIMKCVSESYDENGNPSYYGFERSTNDVYADGTDISIATQDEFYALINSFNEKPVVDFTVVQ